MYVYFCRSCKSLKEFPSKEGGYICTECGRAMSSLGVTTEEWNSFTNDEMLDVIERTEVKKPSVAIKKPVFDVVDDEIEYEVLNDEPQTSKKHSKNGNYKPSKSRAKKSKGMVIGIISAIAIIIVGLGIGAFFMFHDAKSAEFKKVLQNEEINKAIGYYNTNKDDVKFAKNGQKILQNEYLKAVDDKDKNRHMAIANAGVFDEEFVKEMENKAISKINAACDDYYASKIAVEDALAAVDEYTGYRNTSINKAANGGKDSINEFKESQESYKGALEDIQAKKYKDALLKLDKVVSKDPNYDDAQKKKDEILPEYKKAVIAEINSDITSKKYDSAISKADDLLKRFPSDSDITALKNQANSGKAKAAEQKEKQDKEFAKNSQQVEVTSTKVVDGGYYIVDMEAYIVVKNNSNNVAADVSFGILLFDQNGYPVRTEYTTYRGKYDNEYICEHASCNIKPGGSYGSDKYASVPSNCKKAKACVKQVRWLDGSVWNNPYYDYWLEDNHASF